MKMRDFMLQGASILAISAAILAAGQPAAAQEASSAAGATAGVAQAPAKSAAKAKVKPAAAKPAAAAAAKSAPTPPAATPSAAATAAGSDIEEVVVTAQRRSEKAKDVPLTVHAIDGGQLASRPQITKANDVTAAIPNAQSVTAAGPIQPRWFVRGLGTNRTEVNTVNPTAIYFDDVVFSNIINQALPLYDVQRIEVLVGPQGTLWGKAANGGVINYVSNPPTFKSGGYAKAGYGSYNRYLAEGAYGGTLVENKLAGRLSAQTSGTDGWQKNVRDGTTNDSNDNAVRGQLLYTPTDNSTYQLNVHGRRYNGKPRSQQYYRDNSSVYSSAAAGARLLSVYPGGYPITEYGEVDAMSVGRDDITEYGGVLKGNWEFDGFSLSSITGYENASRESKTRTGSTRTNTVAALGYTGTDYWQATQELRIASPTQQTVTWQGGAYLSYQHLDNNATTANQNIPLITSGSGAAGSNLTSPVFAKNTTEENKKSFALFGSSTVKITDDFKLTGGLRWTWENIDYRSRYYAQGFTNTGASALIVRRPSYWDYNAPLQNNFKGESTYGSWTYDVSPQYRVSDNVNVYARYAHGVTPGSYGTTGYLSARRYASAVELEPEVIDAYEAGFKTQWFNKRLNANLTFFDNELSNNITNVPTLLPGNTTTTVIFRNAGKAYVRGGELSLDATPIDKLHIGGNVGVLRSRYVQESGVNLGIKGSQLPRTPKTTLNAFASYETSLPGGGDIVWAGDINWRSQQWFYPTSCSQKGQGCGATGTVAKDDLLGQSAYAVANLHVTWHPDDDKKQAVQFSVLNVADTKYFEHALTQSSPYVTRLPGQPRTFFASFTQKF